jgi:tryptophan halogenase
VVNFVTTDERTFHSLVLDDGSEVEGDLFIDCTGFRSLLLGEFCGEPFVPFDHLLPNDRAWATHVPYTDKEKQLNAYTHCTAIDNGWVWDIPLWSGVGTGYVYSSKYTSDDDAKQELVEHLSDKYDTDECTFKKIHMRVGRHENTWVGNVVAIGLSAGFVEPLESNGLMMVHENLIDLVKTLRRGKPSQIMKQYYNSDIRRQFDQTADFVAIHYAFTQREDTPYWQDVFNKEYNLEESLLNNGTYLNGLFAYGREIYSDCNFRNLVAGLHYVASGMNICPLNRPRHTTVNMLNINKQWEEAVEKLPTAFKTCQDLRHQIPS